MKGFTPDTNDTTSMYNEKFKKAGQSKPALGLKWQNQINDRLCLRKRQVNSSNLKRTILVDNSSHWPSHEMEFEINEKGLFGLSS